MLRNKLTKRKKPLAGSAGEGHRGPGFKDLAAPFFRSPALERVERKREEQANGHGTSRLAARAPQLGKRSLAAEDTLADAGTGRRKSLPLLKGPAALPDTPGPSIPVARSGTLNNHVSYRTGNLARGQRRSSRASLPLQVISEEEQQKLAALEMQLPRVAGRVDPVLLLAALALVCVGLVMVYSASAFESARLFSDAGYYFQKQLVGAILGIVVMSITMRIDYRRWRRFTLLGLAVSFPLLVIVLFVGSSAYGASRWLAFGTFFSFQPSELIKLVLAFYIADWLARKGNQVSTFLYGLTPFVILVGAVIGVVLLQNDMGTASVIAVLATVMFFTAGANILQFLLALSCGILIFLTQAFKGYRYYRIIGFLDPFHDITGINMHLYQSLLALGSGGFFGVGLGASRQKTGYLPFPFIDSIFAVTGEELGFLGGMIIMLLFMVLAFRGFRLARRTQDMYGALLATGITTWLVVQAMINIGASTGSIPYTGVPLPFISFGGTSLVVSLAAVGVLLNISRYIQVPEDPALSRQTIEKIRRK